MDFSWFLKRIAARDKQSFMVWRNKEYTIDWLMQRIRFWSDLMHKKGISKKAVVSIHGDFSPESVAVLLSLVERDCIVVPLSSGSPDYIKRCEEIAEVEYSIEPSGQNSGSICNLECETTHPLLIQMKFVGEPGLVLFSSGSTGTPKAALHAFLPLFERHRKERQGVTALAFLLFDHIGGINTLIYSLAQGAKLVVAESRSPDDICALVERWHVKLLPTTPTFLNLLLLSEAYTRHDLSSLERITYGTEPMPESTLARVESVFPKVKLQQTYGLSELGIMRSQSRENGSLWVKLGGEGFEFKTRDGILWIRAKSAMRGYLNAPSPFDSEGWFNTGDSVEVDGDWLLIKGRVAELINVGGLKVYPAEVESVLLAMPGVIDATVRGETNLITGQIVVAKLSLENQESLSDLVKRTRYFCRDRLKAHEVPIKVEIAEMLQYNDRFKRVRR